MFVNKQCVDLCCFRKCYKFCHFYSFSNPWIEWVENLVSMVFSTAPVDLSLSSDLFNGSLKYYLVNANLAYLDYIKFTASSHSETAYWTIDPNSHEHSWYTEMDTEDPQWYQIELKKGVLYTTSYSMKSSNTSYCQNFHLLGWDLYASIDSYHWVRADQQETEELNYYGAEKPFTLKTPGLFRFFRIMQTKRNTNSKYGFSLQQFDVFGVLYESSYVPFRPFFHLRQCKSFSLSFLFISLFNSE